MALIVRVANGRIDEYQNGSRRRSYGTNAINVLVSGGTVAVTLANGRIDEYVNGSRRRSY